MSYPSVLVFIDSGKASERRLDFALKFARLHNAHLTALHMSYGPLLPFDPYGQVSGVALEWEMEVEKKQKESRQDFTRRAKIADINYDWDCYRDTELGPVMARARVADICLVGQALSDSTDNEINRNFFSQFTVNAGKPVLFIPAEKDFSPEFKHIVVAWNGGREAARAIADALPLLKAARLVSVISITSRSEKVDLPDVDIAAFLARHKVNVDIERIEKPSAEAADFLLSRIDLKSADLLVMGAYGHTRFSEFILGGMTRSIMKKMSVPVLMSH